MQQTDGTTPPATLNLSLTSDQGQMLLAKLQGDDDMAEIRKQLEALLAANV